MCEITDWDKYHQRVRVSQRFSWAILRVPDLKCEKEFCCAIYLTLS